MEKERKTRSDKKIRVNPGLDQTIHDRLEMLAHACSCTKTKMAELIIANVLDDAGSIERIQESLGVQEMFMLRATTIQGKTFVRYKNFYEGHGK